VLTSTGFGKATFQNPLIHSLLQASDLLPELVDLVFEILLTPADSGITGFHNRPEAIHRPDHGPAQKTCGDLEPAERGLAGRPRGRGGREGSRGETARGPHGRPKHEFGGTLAQKQRPSGSPELRRRKFSTAPMGHGYTWQRMMETGKRDLLRSLPAVDVVMRSPSGRTLTGRHGRASATAAVREALEGLRRQIVAGEGPEVSEGAVAEAASRLLTGRGLGRVVNATGVVLHTNLGRSVLSERAALAAYEAATRYSNLEYDLRSGSRGSRYDHAVVLLRELTGAEDALVVNNCAGATLLALAAVVASKASEAPEVIVSRGQLIEIGGGFRIPEVLALSGARLKEVGTTNRTRLSDYENAVTENTRAVLWVHPSNFETVGFTESVEVQDLTSLGLPLIADVGSGALLSVGEEPRVQEVLRDGADLAIFSGDKLLGGPQAGIAVGASRWISAMRHHPLARALRADKLCLAALEATLISYLEGTEKEDLPTLRMIRAPVSEMEDRATNLAENLRSAVPGLEVDVTPSVARSGGGTLPTYEIPSFAVRLGGTDPEALAEDLRSADPPVIGRVREERLWLDVRTLLPGDEEAVVGALRDANG
jgi:L-seryl-tRNA(Ser) seleniumtransferase